MVVSMLAPVAVWMEQLAGTERSDVTKKFHIV